MSLPGGELSWMIELKVETGSARAPRAVFRALAENLGRKRSGREARPATSGAGAPLNSGCRVYFSKPTKTKHERIDMRMTTLLASISAVVLCTLATDISSAQDIESMPPVPVKTVPESGAKDVASGEMEIKVTFSKEMMDNSWSWATAWPGSTPEMIGKPKYQSDGKTCVLKVKLEPNKAYAFWLNSEKFRNFKDRQGHPSVPYLLIFQTKDK